MSPVHVWSCGRCGALVTATVGTIVQAFAAHAAQCPARGGATARPHPDHPE